MIGKIQITSSQPPCKHESFTVFSTVNRITEEEGGTVTDFMLDVRVRCDDCLKMLKFRGMKGGFDWTKPRSSFDRTEARLPLAIE